MKRPGNILPLALLMTMTVLLASIGVGTIVLEGAGSARTTDQSVAAYYMADAGIERQLYEVRKNNAALADLPALGGLYVNGGAWVSTAGLEQASVKKIPYVATSSFAVIDIFDPDNLTTPPGVAGMTISWSKDPSCSGPVSTLEASYGFWSIVNGAPKFPDGQSFFVLPKTSTSPITVSGLDPNSSYRIRLRSYGCPATSVSVTLVDALGRPKNFPGDITLGAEGTFGKATQKIAVIMPKLDVLSGLFGYVIFSECSLVKDPNQAQVCPQ